jgi:hypothetical protein
MIEDNAYRQSLRTHPPKAFMARDLVISHMWTLNERKA